MFSFGAGKWNLRWACYPPSPPTFTTNTIPGTGSRTQPTESSKRIRHNPNPIPYLLNGVGKGNLRWACMQDSAFRLRETFFLSLSDLRDYNPESPCLSVSFFFTRSWFPKGNSGHALSKNTTPLLRQHTRPALLIVAFTIPNDYC